MDTFCECGLSKSYCRELSRRGYEKCEAKKIVKLAARPAKSEADNIALAYKRAGIL